MPHRDPDRRLTRCQGQTEPAKHGYRTCRPAATASARNEGRPTSALTGDRSARLPSRVKRQASTVTSDPDSDRPGSRDRSRPDPDVPSLWADPMDTAGQARVRLWAVSRGRAVVSAATPSDLSPRHPLFRIDARRFGGQNASKWSKVVESGESRRHHDEWTDRSGPTRPR